MRRFRLRRLEKVNIEALLIASGQNVKRLLAFGGHTPKKLTQAAALRPPTITGIEISRAREHRSNRSWRPAKVFFQHAGSFSEHVVRLSVPLHIG
ncbi:MAG: transposase [Actinobacteria bacterium]|nr:transposase [Actinomycetota bacterium]